MARFRHIGPSFMQKAHTKTAGQLCAHESGHTVGLNHQSKYDSNCQLIQTYSTGDGINAPVMGNSLYSNGGLWWVGSTPAGCNVIQNDDEILTNKLGLK